MIFESTIQKANLIMKLRSMGISSKNVLSAIEKIPREIFLPPNLKDYAYENNPLPIGFEQTISQPYIVALMTETLSLKGNEVILEVGTGSGYQTSILSILSRRVYSIERIKPLVVKSRENLRELKIRNVLVKHADGFDGWEEDNKFDGIMCAAAPRQYPEELVELLEIGGKLVIPAGIEGQQRLYVITKKSETEHEESIFEEVAFVPMLPGISNGEI